MHVIRTATTTVTKTRVTPTRTAPSSGSSTSSALASSSSIHRSNDMTEGQDTAPATTTAAKPSIRPDEPKIYDIPAQLHPVYQHMSVFLKATIATISLLLSALVSHLKRQDFGVGGKHNTVAWRKIFLFVTKAVAIGGISRMVVQDMFLAPSRVSTRTLLNKYWLPSPLSKFRVVQPVHETMEMDPVGVHYLEYTPPVRTNEEQQQQQRRSPFKFDAIHFNHGFGASSLSWLPVMPSLVDKLNARIGVAHDSVGFGFTDRPKPNLKQRPKDALQPYGSAGSAAIGSALLQQSLFNGTHTEATPSTIGTTTPHNNSNAVALFGHSMGSIATLRMALSLPKETRKFIVLVAPALMPGTSNVKVSDRIQKPSQYKLQLEVFISSLRRVILDVPLQYFLRRLVGQRDFWKNGLRLAWGDPELVSESDVLRFQWPSIGRGWEKGLLAFTRAKLFAVDKYNGEGDFALLRDVLALPNTSVCILHGDKDTVISSKMIQSIVQAFPQIPLIQLQGQGHDPFEEQTDTFVSAVLSLLPSQDDI